MKYIINGSLIVALSALVPASVALLALVLIMHYEYMGVILSVTFIKLNSLLRMHDLGMHLGMKAGIIEEKHRVWLGIAISLADVFMSIGVIPFIFYKVEIAESLKMFLYGWCVLGILFGQSVMIFISHLLELEDLKSDKKE